MFPTKSETYDKVIYQSNHTGTAVFGRQIKIIFPWKVNIKEKKIRNGTSFILSFNIKNTSSFVYGGNWSKTGLPKHKRNDP